MGKGLMSGKKGREEGVKREGEGKGCVVREERKIKEEGSSGRGMMSQEGA